MRKSVNGFTIVELLIVIVVIAILAAISMVAYQGIQQRAQVSTVQSNLSQIYKKVALTHASTGSWPTRPEFKAIMTEVVPDIGSSDFVYCVISSETFALVAWRPLMPPPGSEVYYISPQKGGLTSVIYTMTQPSSTAGTLCDAALPGYTAAYWYNNM